MIYNGFDQGVTGVSFRSRRFDLPAAERRELLARLEELLAGEPGLACAYVHGSFTAGAPFGDVDVALLFRDDLVPERPLPYELTLEERLEQALGLPVDVRLLNGAPLSFSYQVIKAGRPIAVADDEARVRFQARVWAAYADFAPFRRRYLREVLGLGVESR